MPADQRARRALRPRLMAAAGILLVTAGACAPAATVRLDELRPSDRLRVTSSGPNHVPQYYMLLRQVNGSIEVTDAAAPPFRLDLAELDRLEVMRGRATLRSSFGGAAIGGVAGTLLGMGCMALCRSESGSAVMAPVYGVVAGLAGGAGVGLLRAPPLWVSVRIR